MQHKRSAAQRATPGGIPTQTPDGLSGHSARSASDSGTPAARAAGILKIRLPPGVPPAPPPWSAALARTTPAPRSAPPPRPLPPDRDHPTPCARPLGSRRHVLPPPLRLRPWPIHVAPAHHGEDGGRRTRPEDDRGRGSARGAEGGTPAHPAHPARRIARGRWSEPGDTGRSGAPEPGARPSSRALRGGGGFARARDTASVTRYGGSVPRVSHFGRGRKSMRRGRLALSIYLSIYLCYMRERERYMRGVSQQMGRETISPSSSHLSRLSVTPVTLSHLAP